MDTREGVRRWQRVQDIARAQCEARQKGPRTTKRVLSRAHRVYFAMLKRGRTTRFASRVARELVERLTM
jgi:hypothetical protein